MKRPVGLCSLCRCIWPSSIFSCGSKSWCWFSSAIPAVSARDCQHAAFLYVFNAIDQRLLCRPGHLAILTLIGILRLRSGARYSIPIIDGGCADGPQLTGPTINGRCAAAPAGLDRVCPSTQPGIAPTPSPSGSVPAKQSTPSQPSPTNRTVYPRRKHTPTDYPARAWTRSS
jgi:hypothetical protein